MKWPWVSRLRLDFAQATIAERDKTIEELKEATRLLQEALDLQKQVTHEVEKERDMMATKPHRLLGSQIRELANKAAKDRHAQKGKPN